MKLSEAVAQLIEYAKENLMLDDYDVILVKNRLYDCLQKPAEDCVLSAADVDKAVACETPDKLLDNLLDCAGIKENREVYKDKITDIISALPHAVQQQFDDCRTGDEAMEFLYDYSVKNYYVKRALLDANPRGEKKLAGGKIAYTINLSRPEGGGYGKDLTYPPCAVCAENEGCGMRGRRNLRKADVELGGERWLWQFSPYGYFKQHGIAVSYEHRPMTVDEKTFSNLLEFVDKFPSFFIGCNAALPGVGGSVLTHDHYQGGPAVLPMQSRPIAVEVGEVDGVKVGVVDWYASVVRLTGKDRAAVVKRAERIRAEYSVYSSADYKIVAEDENGFHNAVAPVALKTKDGYQLDLIFKNNRCDEAHPLGIFHVPEKYQCIKKEAIGLIEAQGLFVLPGRLKEEFETLADGLIGSKPLPIAMNAFMTFRDEVKASAKITDKKSANEAMQNKLVEALADILRATAPFPDFAATAQFVKGTL